MTFIREAMDLTPEEELEFFNANLEWIRDHMRYVLDNLDDYDAFWVYKVSFNNYYHKKKQKLYK